MRRKALLLFLGRTYVLAAPPIAAGVAHPDELVRAARDVNVPFPSLPTLLLRPHRLSAHRLFARSVRMRGAVRADGPRKPRLPTFRARSYLAYRSDTAGERWTVPRLAAVYLTLPLALDSQPFVRRRAGPEGRDISVREGRWEASRGF